jgi:Ca2+-binding RTX toxin-like protein
VSITTNADGSKTFKGTTYSETYYVTSSKDVVIEPVSGGTDKVVASADYSLAANIEYLVLAGSAVKGIGNTMNNGITGNELNNWLEGGNGNDKLYGLGGADTMLGGQGGDTFYVTDAGDKVIEYANEGYDWIRSNVDYALPANVEFLVLQGSAVKGTGNSGANYLEGNAGANILDGGAGNDKFLGMGGDDTLTGGTGADTFIFQPGSGKDKVTDFSLSEDRIDFAAMGAKPTISSVNGSAVLSWGADTVTLVGVSANDPLLKAMFAA